MPRATASTEATASTPTALSRLRVLTATDLTRRTVLLGAASAAGVGALAACSPAGGDQPAGTASPGGGTAGVLVALADVPVGGAVSAQSSSGDPVVIAQPQEGQVVGFSAVCTHQGCTVAPDGAELVCPCHGSVFEAATGKNVSGPAPRPLDTFTVRVDNGQVVEG